MASSIGVWIGDVPLRRDLRDQFNAQIGRGLLRAALHGEIEWILHAGQEADLVRRLGRRLSGFGRGFRGLGGRLFGLRGLRRSGGCDRRTGAEQQRNDG